MPNLLLHCGAAPVTFEEVCAVEPPPITETYRTVPHGDLIRLVTDEVQTRFGLTDPEMKFGLGNKGARLFGVMTYDVGTAASKGVDVSAFVNGGDTKALDQYGYSIALRNSYDKSMSIGIAGGTSYFLCDNLAIHGSGFTIKANHSANCWDNLVPQALVKIRDSVGQFVHTVRFLERMRGFDLSDDEAYRTIGLAQGRGVLTPTQAGKCFAEHRALADEGNVFHENRADLFGLYQCFTESLKLGADVMRKMDKYTGASSLFQGAFPGAFDVEDAVVVS